ncbi:uncharacterized protein DUF3500 [Methylovirgula ligni]|uniref:Uncharacterized protein DUF3500 n=1 Tax=Methylovirgula ligni TaxID=569860 RepID=A0A3D9Z495_9HYPH|nr:DUF3500 domain-containing protein [Methylovirgula ligni]REF89118.1 uncharacterized protein DUF3500 [Methylovirgula ligni]
MLLALGSALTIAALCGGVGGAGTRPGIGTDAATDSQTQAIVAAATDFLNALNADQRGKVLFAFTPQKTATAARFRRSGSGGPGDHRQGPGGGPGMGPPGGFVGEKYGSAVWSNFPVSDVPRPGLQLGGLNAVQRAAAMHVLRVMLSPEGYQKVLDIMGSDQALSDRGTPFASGRAVYTIGIFGTPSISTPWMVQFGGHHLGLNVVIASNHDVLAPTLTGAQPSVYTSNGSTVRVLAGENDKAFALLDALDDTQRKQAILNYRVNDLVLGPGHDGETIVPEGLKASAMTAQQRVLLLDLISEWAGIINDAYAKPRMEEIEAGLDDTYFAWSGPTTHKPGRNGSSYYRIQGPKLIIEFSPQGVGGDPTMHVHTIYRDPTNDYGRAFTSQ